jgi:hypothetical protein
MGSDDDDPTASRELGLGLAAPDNAAALDAFITDVLGDSDKAARREGSA